MSDREDILALPPSLWPSVPTGYDGCVLWGDASLLKGFQTGDPVLHWPDHNDSTKRPVAQPNVYSTTTANSVPTYQAAGLNGKPTVQFVRANSQALGCPGSFWESFDPSGAPADGMANFYTSSVRGLTMVLVAQPLVAIGAGLGIVFTRAQPGTLLSVSLQNNNWLAKTARLDVDPTVVGTFPAVVGTPRLIHLASDFPNGVTRVWVDGVLTLTLAITAGLGDPLYSLGTELGATAGGGAYADCSISYFGLWRGYYDKAAFASLLPGVAARNAIVYA